MKSLVKDTTEFNLLIKKYISKKYLNNGNRLIRDYRSLIEENSLYFVENPNYILFYEDCGDFYNLYYFVDREHDHVNLEDVKCNKPIVFDEVIKNGDESSKVIKYFLSLGFKKYLTRNYRELKLGEKHFKLPEEVEFAFVDEVDLICNLQDSHIDKYTGNILPKKNMLRAIENKLVLSVKDKGKTVGYLRFLKEKKTVSLEGIVVDRDYRGSGLAKKLVEYFISYFSADDYKKIVLWVRNDNLGAEKLYDYFGFGSGKYICHNYIKF